MIYTCTIEVKEGDNADKFEKMARAAHDESMWKPKRTRKDILESTDLSNKCGSCKHFRPYEWESNHNHSCGDCAKGRAWGVRTRPACTLYERRPTYGN